MTPLEKYLKTYSVKFDITLENYTWDKGVVLPCFGENVEDVQSILESLKNSAEHCQKKVLAVLVVNQRINAKEEYKQKNQDVLEYFKCKEKEFILHQGDFLSVILLNRTLTKHEFGEKEGVGLARKTGCDFILKLYEAGKITSPWIYTTDIDARVALDYFSEESFSTPTSLKLYPFRHSFKHSDGQALLLYDIWMRYYTLSLKKAGSPFAYSTLGSTFCIEAHCYAMVRGFPNRLAAEDFHLASKLSKVAKIEYSKLSPITLIGRKSDRVPFGTGVGTSKYSKNMESNEEVKFIHPDCFKLLKNFLLEVEVYLRAPQINALVIEQTIESELQLNQIIQTAIQTRTNVKDRLLHFKAAFDALKTLRFIHTAENLFPKIPFQTALRLLDETYDTNLLSLEQISDKMAIDELITQ